MVTTGVRSVTGRKDLYSSITPLQGAILFTPVHADQQRFLADKRQSVDFLQGFLTFFSTAS